MRLTITSSVLLVLVVVVSISLSHSKTSAASNSAGVVRDRPTASPKSTPSQEPIPVATAKPEATMSMPPKPSSVTETSTDAGAAPVINHVNTNDRVVFLTIDDGYDLDPAFRDFVVQKKIPLTMFLVSQAAAVDPGFFSSIASVPGSSIQDHSVSHANLRGASLATQTRQICGNITAEKALFGKSPQFLRPPYGNYDATTQKVAAQCGLKALILWNVSMPSYKIYFASGNRLNSGDIILLHFRDHGGVKNMNSLLQTIHDQGFSVASLTDYIK